MAHSIQRLATGWTVRGSNPREWIFSATPPDRPWGPPSLLYNGCQISFPVVNRLASGVNHTPSSSDEVKEGVELYLYSPSGPSWTVLGRTFFALHIYNPYIRHTFLWYLKMELKYENPHTCQRPSGSKYENRTSRKNTSIRLSQKFLGQCQIFQSSSWQMVQKRQKKKKKKKSFPISPHTLKKHVQENVHLIHISSFPRNQICKNMF